MSRLSKIQATVFIVIIILHIVIIAFPTYAVNDNTSVGRVRLNIETYLAGKDQPTHPSVISFEKKWNGYKYWMVYTPYPEANGEEENPCIAVSNDLYKWETPYGMVNPIADNEEIGCNELKDGHILYRNDFDRLEVWYLGRLSKNLGGDGTSLTLFRKYSYDGITWSSYEVMDIVQYLSPSIIWDGSKYKMWSIGFETFGTEGTFVYQESQNGKNWTEPEKCSIGDKKEDLELWHGSVCFDSASRKYVFVYIPDGGSSQTIESCESEDGVHFTQNQSIVKNDKNTLWSGFYRPNLMIENREYHLFYGVITQDNKWYISYSKGNSLLNLQGITEEDCPKMVTLISTVTDTKSVGYICRAIYHSLHAYLRPETSILAVFLLLINIITNKKSINGKLRLIKLCCCIAICLGYTYIRFKPYGFYAVFGMIGACILEGISIFCVAAFTAWAVSNKFHNT